MLLFVFRFLLGSLVFPIATERPVVGPVIAEFKAPACEWCAGRRGIVFDSVPGEEVRAVADGHVFFAGTVNKVRYVTLLTGDGWKITYGRLSQGSVTWIQGDWVRAGEVVGVAGDELFLSLRRGSGRNQHAYDPALMFRRRARLVPVTPSK